VLKPNNSASWQFNMVLFGCVTLILFCISGYYASLGLWLVFPFAGLEVIVLFTCLYLRVRANNSKEVITFDDTTVIVERGYKYAEKSWKYHRLLTKVFVKQPTIRGYPKQIFIRSHGKQLELGSFLNKKDKDILIKNLTNIMYA
jgi:uncharacterized membrane protein